MSNETTGLVIKKDVKTELTPERRAELGAEIAAHTIAYDELEQAKKDATKELTARMKSERAEMMAVSDVVKRLAMARPDIGFTVEHDGRRVLAVQPTSARPERVAALTAENLALRERVAELEAQLR